MIIFFGPAGSGKSVQGQLLAARNGWRWLSAGQLLRDTRDPEVLKSQQQGTLVSNDRINQVIGDALVRAKDINKVVLDGFPRRVEQARWLVESASDHGRLINLALVLEVPRAELMKRIGLRGRVDDTPESIDERLNIYRQEIYPMLDYFTSQGVRIVHIDGNGTVGQVHDKIMEEITACKLV